jgi:hypothetical protein
MNDVEITGECDACFELFHQDELIPVQDQDEIQMLCPRCFRVFVSFVWHGFEEEE